MQSKQLHTRIACQAASFALSLALGCATQEDGQTRVTGTLVQSIGHDGEGATEVEYQLRSDERWILLRDSDAVLAAQQANTRVTVSGRWSEDGGALLVDALEPASHRGQIRQALSPSAPEGRVAIILIKDQTLSADPYPAESAIETILTSPTSSNHYYQEQSYGNFALSGDVFGWYSADLSNCDVVRTTVTQQMQQRAAYDGFVSDNYRHAIHLFSRPGSDCFEGWGTYGAPDGTGTVWSFNNDSYTVAHEIGHNLGLNHANSYICQNTAGQYVSFGVGCVSNEYYDPYDGMASMEHYWHFNAYSKQLLGWIPAANQRRVTAPGQFTLVPQEIPGSGVQSLLIPIPSSGEALHVELRKQYGFDSPPRFDGAVLVHRVEEPGLLRPTHLLDMSPDTNMADASMRVGQVFQDPLSGVVITLVSQSASEAVVRVAFDGPTCSNGVQDGVESGVDCGNLCAPCASCTLESAVDLGPRSTSLTVASNACVKVSQYPSWWQWSNGLVTLQSGSGTFPVPATWTDACTGARGDLTFTSAWQMGTIGNHTQGCPALIQLSGSGAPLQLSWW